MQMMRIYLTRRKVLQRAFILVDSRLGLKDSDWNLIKSLEESRTKYTIVLTKGDSVDKYDLCRRIQLLNNETADLKNLSGPIMVTSSRNLGGIYELRNLIHSLTENFQSRMLEKEREETQQIFASGLVSDVNKEKKPLIPNDADLTTSKRQLKRLNLTINQIKKSAPSSNRTMEKIKPKDSRPSNQKTVVKIQQFGRDKITEMEIDPTDPILRIKEQIEKLEGIPISQQRLIFKGKTLVNDKTTNDYKIAPEDTIILILFLRPDELTSIMQK
eukprot:TRINITY_DN2965_c0_g1_i2.p1 TRINITY_DN2965_c0_g1~~TRINITY_DN2965_c0_g1_i2.p1  ORF type:complete len:272 (+),score=47.04 TRINITY_DN2965_c0_g1_i2:664-1479(+)